ncbi:MAG: dihydrofolate reductase [Anaerovoracaceae bacterium]
MKAIVAVDKNWGIGNCGELLCKIPGDLLYFKEKTKDKVVVMGRNTFESLPGGKPLKDRVNTVLTRRENYEAPCCICSCDEELRKLLREYDEDDIYIIGGESVYRQYLEDCDTIYVTKIEGDFEADTFFPNLDLDDRFELSRVSDPYEEKGLTYRFTEYRKKKGT